MSGVAPPPSFSVELTTKDIRRLCYQFDTQEQRTVFLERLNKSAFYGAGQLPTRAFAPKYHASVFGDLAVPATSNWKHSMEKEFERLKDRPAAKNFRLIDQGADYSMFPTYPRYNLIPADITEEIMEEVAAYRSSKRVPSVVWIHPTTGTSLSRCSQPRTGFSKTSMADQNLVKSIWKANPRYSEGGNAPQNCDQLCATPASVQTTASASSSSSTSISTNATLNKDISSAPSDGSEAERTTNGRATSCTPPPASPSAPSPTMLILDARSRAAATANLVVGGGYEGIAGYGKCTLEFAGIANIHAVRESFLALHDICSENKITEHVEVLSTQWYGHIHTILTATQQMVNAMENGASVLTHCSDGWDRTSQLSSLVQLILDPYFRTAQGFCKLIQKEWLSFGHKFRDRMCFGAAISKSTTDGSPVFLQFIDAVAQIIQRYPNSFEFNENFLIAILDLVHSGQTGEFLVNCEAAYMATYATTTTSCWSMMEALWAKEKKKLCNSGFDLQAGPIRLNTVISSLSIWEAYFHRYNAMYFESLRQRKSASFWQNESSLSSSLMQGTQDEHGVERKVWSDLLHKATANDLISSQVREQIVHLYELLAQGVPECHVRLHFRGDELQQMVVQQNPAYRVQKMVPNLKEAIRETYTPSASSVHQPDSLVVLRTTSSTTPAGKRLIHSTLLISNYKFLYDTLAGWSLKIWRSASSLASNIASRIPMSAPTTPPPSPSPFSSETSSSSSASSSSAPPSTVASTEISSPSDTSSPLPVNDGKISACFSSIPEVAENDVLKVRSEECNEEEAQESLNPESSSHSDTGAAAGAEASAPSSTPSH